MNINLTPEQERIVNDELKSGHFRSAEEVIDQALVALREKYAPSLAGHSKGRHELAVREISTLSRRTALPYRASRLSN